MRTRYLYIFRGIKKILNQAPLPKELISTSLQIRVKTTKQHNNHCSNAFTVNSDQMKYFIFEQASGEMNF